MKPRVLFVSRRIELPLTSDVEDVKRYIAL